MNSNVLQKVMEQLADQRARNEREEERRRRAEEERLAAEKNGCAPRGGDEKRVLSLCHSGG